MKARLTEGPISASNDLPARRTPGTTGPRHRLAVLLSGRGSNFEAIADAVATGAIRRAEIVAVISDVPGAAGLERARERGLPAYAVDRRKFAGRREHEAEILRILEAARPDLICLAGYMRVLSPEFVARFPRRILNIDPALLPKFPGLHAQRRALEAGQRWYAIGNVKTAGNAGCSWSPLRHRAASLRRT